MVEILEAKSAAPTIPQGKERPARKNTCPVTFTLRVERMPVARIATTYAMMMPRSRVGIRIWLDISDAPVWRLAFYFLYIHDCLNQCRAAWKILEFCRHLRELHPICNPR